MKGKEKKDLITKQKAELLQLLKEARDGLVAHRMEQAKSPLKNTRAMFHKRKDIARILTVLAKKDL